MFPLIPRIGCKRGRKRRGQARQQRHREAPYESTQVHAPSGRGLVCFRKALRGASVGALVRAFSFHACNQYEESMETYARVSCENCEQNIEYQPVPGLVEIECPSCSQSVAIPLQPPKPEKLRSTVIDSVFGKKPPVEA